MSKKRGSPDSVISIDLTGDDDDDDDEQKQRLGDIRKNLACEFALKKKAKVKSQQRKLDLNVDGIEIVEKPTASPIGMPVAQMSSNAADDGIEILGVEMGCPHMRQDCTRYKFDRSSSNCEGNYSRSTLQNNQQCCDMCYCCVCDCPAKICNNWYSDHASEGMRNHCCGNNTVAFWKTQWSIHKATGLASLPPASAPESPCQRAGCNQGVLPKTEMVPQGVSARDVKPLKSTFQHQVLPCQHVLSEDYTRQTRHSDLDYCIRCGRVARVEDFGKDQAVPFKKLRGGLCIGYREVKFTILPRDIRNDERYHGYWAEVRTDQSWEAEMEEEVFRYSIGPNPQPSKVAEMLKLASVAWKPSELYDYIMVQTEQDCDLLLCAVSCRFTECEIKASWNKSKRQGILRIGIDLKPIAFSCHGGSRDVAILMGLWFRIFPLNISDLALTSVDLTRVRSLINYADRDRDQDGYWKPFFENVGDELVAEVKQQLSGIANAYGQASSVASKQLKLLGSTGDAHQGFVCPQYPASFSDLFRRFYSTNLSPRAIRSFEYTKLQNFQLGNFFGRSEEERALGTVPSTFLDVCIEKRCSSSPIRELMEQMENLGHKDHGIVDGLNIELLGFQRQTLQWALERETTEGGIQMWFWAKLPADPTRKDGNDVYFNPLLGRFRRGPPELVRGGFIAEEKGLGKTVISLALILENPAPEEPVSGSSIADLEEFTMPSLWDKTLYGKTSRSNKKRGSILSRGTLVICPSSLVGKWVEEAKSKLKDPGRIYQYCGADRKGDASFLARNSIVVTTYRVLISDACYHTNKGCKDYCAPLEQVRWWRMICDESHMLGDGNTAISSAVSSLVVDHKWLVSGTPLTTGFQDLINQFKILGIEHADELVRKIDATGGIKPLNGERSEPSLVPFLLGGLMIRHSQKQKYQGTGTTLMSELVPFVSTRCF